MHRRSGGILTVSPGFSTCGFSPMKQMRPTPDKQKSVCPTGWECHAVRAPGVNVTTEPPRRACATASAPTTTSSWNTVPAENAPAAPCLAAGRSAARTTGMVGSSFPERSAPSRSPAAHRSVVGRLERASSVSAAKERQARHGAPRCRIIQRRSGRRKGRRRSNRRRGGPGELLRPNCRRKDLRRRTRASRARPLANTASVAGSGTHGQDTERAARWHPRIRRRYLTRCHRSPYGRMVADRNPSDRTQARIRRQPQGSRAPRRPRRNSRQPISARDY